MSRRIDVELTSARPDGTWTWRAAGAREPRGSVDASLIPPLAKVGDVVRVDADFDLDGITILSVLPPKAGRREPERLTLVTGKEFQAVTSTLTGRPERRERPDRTGRPERPERPRGARTARPERADDRAPRTRDTPDTATQPDRPRRPRAPREGARSGERADAPDATTARAPRRERSATADRPDRAPRGERPARPPVEAKPKAKRLRPARVHRDAVLADLPEEQRPVAETVLRGGVPALRHAIEEQNVRLRASGQTEITSDALVTLAENLLPRLRVAEWHDRADAALAHADEIDLRDLRSVVAAANDAARDGSTRDLTAQLREVLSRRQDREFAEWLTEIAVALGDGRVVRALRLSSRPPKAGVPFPAESATRLSEAASAALTAEATTERWLAVLDALALSPVRALVVPVSLPAEPAADLLAALARHATALPRLASIFGVTPAAPPELARRPPRRSPAPPRPPAPEPAAVAAPATVPPTQDANDP